MERDLEALLPLPAVAYDACEKQAGRVSSLSLVRYRTNDYSAPVAYGHRDVLVKGYVDRVVISCGSEVIARHHRSYQRDDFVFDPVHYLPLLEQKTAALDQAAPLQGWDLPAWISQIELNSLNMRPSGMEQTIKLHTEPVNGHAIRSIPPLSWRNHLLTSLKVRNPRPLPKRLPRGGLFTPDDPITLSPIPSLPEWTILAPAEAG